MQYIILICTQSCKWWSRNSSGWRSACEEKILAEDNVMGQYVTEKYT